MKRKNRPTQYPKLEDVDKISLGGLDAYVVPVTDENRAHLVEAALSNYLGERCKYCLRVFDTLASLSDAVFAGYHGHGRTACKSCWDANN